MILSPFRIPLSFKIWGLGFSFMDFILQRRSLIQVLLISLLALILTVSLLLGGILLWQGRAESPRQTPAALTSPTAAVPGDQAPAISVAATEGGFRVQGSGWPGFSELTLSVAPTSTAAAGTLPMNLGAVVANAKGSFNATFTWAAVAARQGGVSYDLVASSASGGLAARTPFNVAAPLPGNTPSVLPPITATPQPSPAPDQPTCTVIADALNLRSGPGTAYSVIIGLPYRTAVTPLARTASADWLQVALDDGTAGWVTASYLECNVRIADLPVVQTPQPTVTANPIVAAIAIAPVQGWAGTSVSISGVNWTPGATVYVSLGAPNAGPTGDVYAQGAVGQDGRFGANFVFPAEDRWLALSQVIVVAHTQDYQRSANATFALSRPAPQITEWKGEYFNNRNLSGASVLVRNDSSVDFNWGSAAPAAGLPADNFSVRWTRTLRFDAGDYRFYARSDDGVRIWLDNWLVTDQWYDGGAGLRSGDFQGVGAGEHTVRIEYYEGQGDAFATIWWERTGPITEWKGEYFNNTNLDDVPVLVRNDSAINFNWGSDAPAAQIARDYFSARWTRKLSFEDGLYRFSVRADDGVRLWINGQPTIDQWHDSQSQTYTADVPLAAGAHSIKLEYYERSGGAMIEFSWKRIGSRSPIQPQISLAPAGSGQFTVTGSNWPTTTSSRGGATTPGVPTPGGITTPGGSGSSSGGSSSARVGVEVSLRLQTVPVSGQSAIAYRFELGKVMTDSNGRLRATYPIPPGVPEGAYLIASSGKIEVKTPFILIAVQPGSPIITQPGVTR